jgi:hypothetical protein
MPAGARDVRSKPRDVLRDATSNRPAVKTDLSTMVNGAWRVAALVATAASCGEVYADIDVRKAASIDPVFEPSSVYSGNITWVAVRARVDGDAVSIDEHGLDGSQNVKLAYDRLDFFAGACPTSAVSEAVASGDATVAEQDDGTVLFCVAIEVGPFEATTVLPIRVVYWTGTERVTGTADLTVIAGAQ